MESLEGMKEPTEEEGDRNKQGHEEMQEPMGRAEEQTPKSREGLGQEQAAQKDQEREGEQQEARDHGGVFGPMTQEEHLLLMKWLCTSNEKHAHSALYPAVFELTRAKPEL
mmetsp:Transcript_52187/g.89804  ORF Transcript_52187/g.89804 Transcript_52187/m.89804 type:complete len:111 (+) Transcript_52187:280-612(+)